MIGSAVVPVLGALLLSVVAAECLIYGTKIGLVLVRLGVRLLPARLRDEFREEWSRHIIDLDEEGHRLSAMLWGVYAFNASLKMTVRPGAADESTESSITIEAALRTVVVLVAVGSAYATSALLLVRTGSTVIPAGAMVFLGVFYVLWFLDVIGHRPKSPEILERHPNDVKDLHHKQLASVLAGHYDRGATIYALSERFGLDQESILSLIRSHETRAD